MHDEHHACPCCAMLAPAIAASSLSCMHHVHSSMCSYTHHSATCNALLCIQLLVPLRTAQLHACSAASSYTNTVKALQCRLTFPLQLLMCMSDSAGKWSGNQMCHHHTRRGKGEGVQAEEDVEESQRYHQEHSEWDCLPRAHCGRQCP